MAIQTYDVAEPVSITFGTAALGDTTLVAAVAGKRIRVNSLFVFANSDVSVYFKSGTTAASVLHTAAVPATLTPANGYVLPEQCLGWGTPTPAGESLVINLSLAIGVSGSIAYSFID